MAFLQAFATHWEALSLGSSFFLGRLKYKSPACTLAAAVGHVFFSEARLPFQASVLGIWHGTCPPRGPAFLLRSIQIMRIGTSCHKDMSQRRSCQYRISGSHPACPTVFSMRKAVLPSVLLACPLRTCAFQSVSHIFFVPRSHFWVI